MPCSGNYISICGALTTPSKPSTCCYGPKQVPYLSKISLYTCTGTCPVKADPIHPQLDMKRKHMCKWSPRHPLCWRSLIRRATSLSPFDFAVAGSGGMICTICAKCMSDHWVPCLWVRETRESQRTSFVWSLRTKKNGLSLLRLHAEPASIVCGYAKESIASWGEASLKEVCVSLLRIKMSHLMLVAFLGLLARTTKHTHGIGALYCVYC